ncbi:MAG: TOMM precursor leader peptide-binding protein [Alphaproteobacteria bacterium]|nr:MAG: TOMM precursor leader peptide-binding protein [Alphaproteobacteria bacterium]
MEADIGGIALRAGLFALSTQQGALVVGESDRHIFTGQAFSKVMALLDGTRSETELLQATRDRLSPGEFFYVLGKLRAAGVLASERRADIEANSASSVHVESCGGADAEPLRLALRGVGITAMDAAAAAFRVVVCRHYREAELAQVNRRALADGQPWLPVKLTGRCIWIGPLLQPHHSACWECLAQRLRLNFQAEDFVARKSGISPAERPWPTTPLTLSMASSLAAHEIAAMIARPERLADRLLTFDWRDRSTRWHQVTRRPQCPICGTPQEHREPRPARLGRSAKAPGQQRVLWPDEVAHRFAGLVSPISGVVSWLVPADHDVHGLSYNVSSGHNFSMGLDTVEWLRRSLATRTGGKGGSRAEAQASAIGEAVERYSSVFRGEEATHRASYAQLGPAAVHPAQVLHFSETQYRNRTTWNAAQQGSQFHVVPNPFREDVEIDWSPVWSLTDNRFRFFPTSFCYFGHADSARHFFFAGDTNGCAAGSTPAEAFTYAFYELVERDGVALWWYNRARRPGVDVDSFSLPQWKQLRSHYASLGREIWVLDLTTDLGIPTFAALSARVDRHTEDLIFGFSAHLSAREALSGALRELNQFLPAVSRRDAAGHTLYAWPEEEAIAWWRTATRASEPYLLPAPAIPPRRACDFVSTATDDIGLDAEECLVRARSCGLPVYALDMTRPDIGMNVCRVIVPGLRHFWRRLGPGRLYETPVALGWIDRPCREDELNPHSIFV